MKWDTVHHVEVVLSVEINIVAAHDHHHFAISPWSSLLRVDNECAVQAFGNVLGQRSGMAVVEVDSERFSVEFVGIFPARLYHARRRVEYSVHVAGMDTVKVNAVLVVADIDEPDPHPVALAYTNGWAGNASVIGPGRELKPRHDFNGLVLGYERVLAQRLAAGQDADVAAVEVG